MRCRLSFSLFFRFLHRFFVLVSILCAGITSFSFAQLNGVLKLVPDTREYPTTVVLSRKPVVIVRTLLPSIRFESNNPNFKVESVSGEVGVWRLTLETKQTYLIKVAADGYQTSIERRFYPASNREVQHWLVVSEAIEAPRKAFAILSVKSQPEPVSVKIEGQPGRFSTPYIEPKMPAGTYKLIAQSENPYLKPDTILVDVGIEDTSTVLFDLKESVAFIRLASSEGDQRLFIQNKLAFVQNPSTGNKWAPSKESRFSTTNESALRVPSGKIAVQLETQGFYPINDSLFVPENTTLDWNPALKPLSGTLSVTSSDSTASLIIDGKVQGPVPVELSLAIGSYEIYVKTPSGKRTKKERISIETDQRFSVEITEASFSSYRKQKNRRRFIVGFLTASVTASSYLLYTTLTAPEPGFANPPNPPAGKLR